MKYTLVILFLAAAVIPSVPQKTNSPSKPAPPSIELGFVKVWLAMPKAQVLAAAKEVNYTVIDRKPTEITLLSGTGSNGHAYTVMFNKDGLLIYADRSWTSAKEPYEGILGALKTVAGDYCHVTSEPLHEPDANLDRVFLQCSNGRTILIVHGKTTDIPDESEVYERIGDY
jgi:hypothetical protein